MVQTSVGQIIRIRPSYLLPIIRKLLCDAEAGTYE